MTLAQVEEKIEKFECEESLAEQKFDQFMVNFEGRYYDWFYTKTPLGKIQCAVERFCGMETTYDRMKSMVERRKARLAKRTAIRQRDGV